jgi:ABC-type uncharacterized transport system substrate-binding protein
MAPGLSRARTSPSNIAGPKEIGNYDRLPALAAELVGGRVAIILAAGGPPSAIAAKKASTVIPIVFSAADDPVGLGLVQSLSRPGGNVTGPGGECGPRSAST